MAKLREAPRPTITTPAKSTDTRFKMGEPTRNPFGRGSGPGSHRDKVTKAFLHAVAKEFERRGIQAIKDLDAKTFIGVVERLVPAQVQVETENTIYVLSDRPISPDDWAAKYADPEPTTIDAKPNGKVH